MEIDFNSEYNEESSIIWRGNYLLDDGEVQGVKDALMAHPESYKADKNADGNIWSSYFIGDIYDRPEIVFLDVYKRLAYEISKSFHLTQSISSFDYWSQLYDGNHIAHNHHSGINLYSFVHFVEPVGKNFHFLDCHNNKRYPKQEKCDIIVFPSWATHAIDASYGKDRFTIAGNIEFATLSIGNTGSNYRNTKVRSNLFIMEKLDGSN